MTGTKLVEFLCVCSVALMYASLILRMRLLAEGREAGAVRKGLCWLWLGAGCIFGLLTAAGALVRFDIRTLTSQTAAPVLAMMAAAAAVAVLVRRMLKRLLEGP